MIYDIDKKLWSECQICKKSLKDIKKDFGGGNCYFSHAFKNHINSCHNLTLEEYFENIVKINRPICKCGICNSKVKITIKGSKIFWRTHNCGRFDGSMRWYERAKIERRGLGNPMYGKTAWNKGLGLDHPVIARLAAERRGSKTSEETKEKQRRKRQEHPLKARHTTPHSQKTKQIIRENTIRLIKEGVFKQTKTKPHIAMCEILDELNLKYQEEVSHGHFSFDIFLEDLDCYIEVDGDYFHSNPKFYPNGPETKTQKINYSRDCSKNNYCKENGIKLLRFWENDILKNKEFVKETILCTLKI